MIFVTPGDASEESAPRFIELPNKIYCKDDLLKTLKHSIIVVTDELNDTKGDSELIKNQTSRNQVIMDRYSPQKKVSKSH